MGEDSRTQEIGQLNLESSDLDVITWKIPKVSSLHFVDYGVESTPFSFANASWILKIYFYGQKKFNSNGYIDVIIERLDSAIEVHDTSCKIYCKNVFGKEFQPISKKFSFYSNHTTMKALKIMENFQRRLDKWEIAPNDTFTLVCEIENKTPMVDSKPAKGKKCTMSGHTKKPESVRFVKVYEVHEMAYQLETVKWTIHNASSLPSPADRQVQSPPFAFANASWTLKIYPYFRMGDENKQSFFVALTRLQSRVPEHYVSADICFEDHIKKSLHEISRSYVFDSNHIQGDAISFMLRKEQIKAPHDIFTLFCKFRTKKNAESKLSSERNFLESAAGVNCKSEFSSGPRKNKVLQDLKELFEKQEDCDVIIRVQEQEFQAHRAILKARSPVFDSAFRNDMKEKATGVIDIEDCDPTTFSDFLCFLYCGDMQTLSVENVFSLFTTADKYEVMDLRSECVEFLKHNLSVETFCDTIAMALQHSETELIKLSTDFFEKNLQKIILTVKWQSFLVQYPTQSNELFIKALISDESSNM